MITSQENTGNTNHFKGFQRSERPNDLLFFCNQLPYVWLELLRHQPSSDLTRQHVLLFWLLQTPQVNSGDMLVNVGGFNSRTFPLFVAMIQLSRIGATEQPCCSLRVLDLESPGYGRWFHPMKYSLVCLRFLLWIIITPMISASKYKSLHERINQGILHGSIDLLC